MLVPPESSSAVLVMVSSTSVSICNRFHAKRKRANSGKITISKGRGYPSLMPSFEGSLVTQRHQITSLEARDYRLSYGENPESVSHLALHRYRVVTDRQTDGQNCHSIRALSSTCRVQLSRVKCFRPNWTRNMSSWDARQHQFNFVRMLILSCCLQ